MEHIDAEQPSHKRKTWQIESQENVRYRYQAPCSLYEVLLPSPQLAHLPRPVDSLALNYRPTFSLTLHLELLATTSPLVTPLDREEDKRPERYWDGIPACRG